MRTFTTSTDPQNHGNNSGQLVVVQEKRPYGVPIENEIQGVYTFKSGNFSGIPIVPMNYINGQSQLVGNRATLVAYDLILSGLVNNVSDGQILYWVIQNAEAMDEYDDKKMLLDIIKSHSQSTAIKSLKICERRRVKVVSSRFDVV